MKSNPKKPAVEKVSDAEVRRRIAETAGMQPDEIIKLLESISHIEEDRQIIHRKPTESLKKRFRLFPEKKTTAREALDQAKEQAKAREELEAANGKRKKGLKPRDVLNADEYPKRLTPGDIGKAIEGARLRIAELDATKTSDTVSQRKAELLLHIMTVLKRQEATRIAKRIALKQKLLYEYQLQAHHGTYVPPEGRKLTEQEAEEAIEQAKRQLEGGFGKGVHTLIDDAAGVVDADVEAAASVVKQWVGLQHKED